MVARLLLVGAGGALGAMLRYVAGTLALRVLPASFPYGTFIVNVTGCFAIGVLAAVFDRSGSGLAPRLFWVAGVLGGYTTFSTFGYDTLVLLRQDSLGAAIANVAGQVVLGLLAVWAGTLAGRA